MLWRLHFFNISALPSKLLNRIRGKVTREHIRWISLVVLPIHLLMNFGHNNYRSVHCSGGIKFTSSSNKTVFFFKYMSSTCPVDVHNMFQLKFFLFRDSLRVKSWLSQKWAVELFWLMEQFLSFLQSIQLLQSIVSTVLSKRRTHLMASFFISNFFFDI